MCNHRCNRRLRFLCCGFRFRNFDSRPGHIGGNRCMFRRWCGNRDGGGLYFYCLRFSGSFCSIWGSFLGSGLVLLCILDSSFVNRLLFSFFVLIFLWFLLNRLSHGGGNFHRRSIRCCGAVDRSSEHTGRLLGHRCRCLKYWCSGRLDVQARRSHRRSTWWGGWGRRCCCGASSGGGRWTCRWVWHQPRPNP